MVAGVVVGVAAEGAAEEEPEGGQAGADDADVELDAGPEAYLDYVACLGGRG